MIEPISASSNKEMEKRETRGRKKKSAMVVTNRDQQIVRWVAEIGLCTREQVRKLFFGPGGRSRCQFRLTLLVRHKYLDTLPGRWPNAPAVYCLSRRSSNGLKLLRTCGVNLDEVRPTVRRRLLDHSLSLVDCRIQFELACRGSSATIECWIDEARLLEMTAAAGIRPDAYFELSWNSETGRKCAAFFLEVERSDKPERTVKEKFLRYGRFYHGGEFRHRFGMTALSVLVLVAPTYGIRPERRIQQMSETASSVKLTLLRFASLEELLALPPARVLTANVWRLPGDAEQRPLISSFNAVGFGRSS
jgi:hypothetical protein